MRINISRLSVPTLPDTEEGTKEGGGKPLYQPGLAIHPTLQKLAPRLVERNLDPGRDAG